MDRGAFLTLAWEIVIEKAGESDANPARPMSAPLSYRGLTERREAPNSRAVAPPLTKEPVVDNIPCVEISRCHTVDLETALDGSTFCIQFQFTDPEDSTVKAVRALLDPGQAAHLSALLAAACSHFRIEVPREKRGPKDAN